jgi:tRNA threonylcarbamoyladenosine modification (KEOPS) complex  Pcc1 subunit
LAAKATVRLPFQSEKQLAAVFDALTPEVQRQIGTRSKVVMQTDGLTLILNFEAKDTVALRAAMNSNLRWVNSMLNVIQAITPQ